LEYRALGLLAKFTIRWAQTSEGEHWRIVLWQDDVGSPQALSAGGGATDGSTWGGIKAQYD